jgi:hypothetical protein
VAGIAADPRSYRTAAGIAVRVLRLPNASVGPLAIFGDSVTWAGAGNLPGTPPRLYTSRLSPFRPRLLAIGIPCEAWDSVRISADWIVWVQPGRGQERFWALDRHTGQRILLDTHRYADAVPCLGIACQPPFHLALSGDTVVWMRLRIGRPGDRTVASILQRRLPDGQTTGADVVGGRCLLETQPEMVGQTLLWQRVTYSHLRPNDHLCNAMSGQLLVDNPYTAHSEVVTSRPVMTPATNGTFVVWLERGAESDCACGRLQLLDLRTGRRTTVSASGASLPVLTAHAVVWVQQRHGQWLEARDVRSGRTVNLAALPATGSRAITSTQWGGGGRIGWVIRSVHDDGMVASYLAEAEWK